MSIWIKILNSPEFNMKAEETFYQNKPVFHVVKQFDSKPEIVCIAQ